MLGVMATAVFGIGCRHRPAAEPAPVTSAGVRIRQISNGTQITGDEQLLFESGKSNVKPQGQDFLNRLSKALRDKPKATVLVEGHTDNVGAATMNQTLSEKRALSVRQGLIDRGVPASRVSARGLGMAQPVGDNTTAEGRASNRRTEIFVIGDSIETLD
jgi:outer membrane protein OmpA-like peptidoglycan-associated protein